MTTEPSHLTASAAELLSESNATRIRAILAERWVHYPRAGQVLQMLNRLLNHPRSTRMPSIAIYGRRSERRRPQLLLANDHMLARPETFPEDNAVIAS